MAFETANVAWPGWEVVDKLGEGSFGGVYEIRRTLPDGTEEHAALKKLTIPKNPEEIAELHDQCYDCENITAHFKEQMQDLVREYSFMRKLGNNPYVVHCQDLRAVQHEDSIGWDIYIRMELLKPLKAWLNNRYDEDAVIRLGLNICGALSECHQKNIIHRDIKPENILVSEEDTFKLADFGIAKVCDRTATGTLIGTYGYMAPEIANRKHYGTSADIYSLGMVMYWIMNDRILPFLPLGNKIPSGIQRQESQDRRFSGEEIPAPLNGSPELKRIVLKACAFLPEDRYHSVQELAKDLDALCCPAVQRQYGGNQKIAKDVVYPKYQDEDTVLAVPSEQQPQQKPCELIPPQQEQPLQNIITSNSPQKGYCFGKNFSIGIVIFAAIALIIAISTGISMLNILDTPNTTEVLNPTEMTDSIRTPVATDISNPVEEPTTSPLVFTYEQNATGLTITLCKDKSAESYVIPSTIDGIPVTHIGECAFLDCTNLHSISIPDSISSIGRSAFNGCTNLSRITIPNNVLSIGDWAFKDCTSLSSINIPDGVTSIGDGAFMNCSNLSSINIPISVISIGNSTFRDCISLNSITIPNSIACIGDWTFYGCTNLRSITIPDSVTSIGRSAFNGCTNLSSITIPNGVASIEYGAFYRCASLSSITIPSSVTTIGVSAFEECSKLSSVTIPDSVTSIEDWVFCGCTSLSSITIPDGVTSIGKWAFDRCTDLSSVTISRDCVVGEKAFPPTCQVLYY